MCYQAQGQYQRMGSLMDAVIIPIGKGRFREQWLVAFVTEDNVMPKSVKPYDEAGKELAALIKKHAAYETKVALIMHLGGSIPATSGTL